MPNNKMHLHISYFSTHRGHSVMLREETDFFVFVFNYGF